MTSGVAPGGGAPASVGEGHVRSAAPRRLNPIWIREMQQAARFTMTPILLAVLTSAMALLLCAIGGIASVSTAPAEVGHVLYQVFFSLAYAVVTWIAPAIAASTVASERGGRTWEALLLTGMTPTEVARGKFLAALTYIGAYVVMLAPVGALPFLFGGVTAVEVVMAFVLLGVFAVLGVAFGLSVSARFTSSAAAVVVTLLVSSNLSIAGYLGLGVGISFGVHELWSGVTAGAPVWMPTAYVRGDFGLEYVAILVFAPLVFTLVPAWFLYEATIASMASPSEDRSSGLRRWLMVCTPLVTLACVAALPVAPSDEFAAAALATTVLWTFLTFAVFVVAGEPLGPSRRVRVRWDREGATRLGRYLGPGLMNASTMVLGLGFGALLTVGVAGVVLELWRGGPSAEVDALRVALFTAYVASFFGFQVGFGAWCRSRAGGASLPRFLQAGALLVAFLGPWVLMAIAGLLTRGADGSYVVASPSPVYAAYMMELVASTRPERESLLLAGVVAALGWLVLGVALLGAAGRRASKVVAEHAAAIARLEAALEAEDAAAREEVEVVPSAPGVRGPRELA